MKTVTSSNFALLLLCQKCCGQPKFFIKYLLGEAGGTVEFLKDKEYLGTVQDMHLNGDYCAVRFDGKILLHVLEVQHS